MVNNGPLKKVKKTAKVLVVSSIGLGVGAVAVGALGGNQGGLTTFSRFLSPIATVAGAGITLGLVQSSFNSKKKNKKGPFM